MQASTTKATWVEPVVYAGIEYIASAFQAGYDGSGLSWRGGTGGAWEEEYRIHDRRCAEKPFPLSLVESPAWAVHGIAGTPRLRPCSQDPRSG
jgi:hypothetical protein